MGAVASRGWRGALTGLTTTAAVVALVAAGVVPASASPSDPADPGFYLWGQSWSLVADGVSVAQVGGSPCTSGTTVSFRKGTVTTALTPTGKGFPSWGSVSDFSFPAGLLGAGQIVVKCTGGAEVVAIPFTIRTSAPVTTFHTDGQWTTFTDAGDVNFTVNKVGFLAGESVRVTPYDESTANEDDFELAAAPTVTVQADAGGAITSTTALPVSFAGDDYRVMLTSLTSRIIYDASSTGSVSTDNVAFTTDAATAVSGSAVGVAGEGYAANETVAVALHGAATAALLTTFTADASGAFSGSVTIPASTPAGQYRLWAGSKSESYFLLNSPITITNAPLANTVLPAISGSSIVGGTLTASKGTWAAVAAPAPVFTYSWWRDGAAIAGATAATYKPTLDDFEATLTVRVQASKAAFGTTTAESLPTAPIGAGVLAPAAVPTIAGTAKVGATLTAATGAWAAGTAFTYQWSANAVPIAGATNPTVVLAADQFGKKITVTVTGTKTGLVAAKTSLPTLAVASIPFAATVAPTISGTPQVGVALTADPGAWSPAATFSYQWLASGVVIAGATGQSFTPKGAQLGKLITVRTTGSAVGAIAAARVSLPTTAVTLGAYSATPEPTVTGTALVGSPLTASTAGWDAGSTFSYRWFADSVPIAAATAAAYVPTATQVGEVITVRVTSTTPGYPVVVRTSSVGSAAVGRGVFATAPTPTIKASTTGALRFGSTLTAVPGAWAPAAVFTYQWFADGTEIIGAEAATYKPTVAQIGAVFTVRVIGTKSGYTSTARTSAPTAALAPLAFTITPVTASISGTAKVGQKLTAVVGTFTPAAAYTYQWFADGAAIDGATAATFTVTGEQTVGMSITVEITGTLAGYATTSKLSTGKTVAAP